MAKNVNITKSSFLVQQQQKYSLSSQTLPTGNFTSRGVQDPCKPLVNPTPSRIIGVNINTPTMTNGKYYHITAEIVCIIVICMAPICCQLDFLARFLLSLDATVALSGLQQ